ncbi:GNAT family N-acetyltransferase [Embleya sp. NBC_00896]|uniref:GNAT family N-acetyltransferase n=1 Tax=Embleya sp. NBC_00896 TaxID=2975961 RepID=UPI002F907F8E|nr:GNAT family N-acetyltransferase [Embleya sp. NBC_00896]
MSTFLETPRLVLRAFTESDVDHLVELDSDPAVMRFINGGRPTPRERVRGRVMPQLLHDFACLGTRGFWAAEERSSGRFLGWFEYLPLAEDSAEVVELGYRLRRDAWGVGYATEGSRALVHKGFTDFDVQRVTANTMTVNTASRSVMAKVGLTFTRTYFGNWSNAIEGSEHGEVEYTLTRSDWTRQRKTETDG